MNTATHSFDIRDIPGLSPNSMITPISSKSPGGLNQVILPTGHTAIHLTGYVDVQKVLMDISFIRSETNTEDGPSFLPTVMPNEMLLNLDHPDHGRLKHFVAAPYSANSMNDFAPKVRDIVLDQLERIDDPESFDLMADVISPVTIKVNAAFLGIADSEIPKFRHLSRQMQLAPEDNIPQLLEDFWDLYHYLEDIISGQVDLKDGLITDLLDRRNDVNPPVTDDEYVAILLGSLVGGDQNVLSELSKIVYVCLVKHEAWEWLSEDPELVPSTTEELLRLLPLGRISTFPRIASRQVELEEGRIYPGEVVYADAHAANRDQTVFPSPWTVNIQRNSKKHLQFGYGMHHCMGAAMARMVIRESMGVLTEQLPTLSLAVPPESIKWDTGVLVHRPLSLPVSK